MATEQQDQLYKMVDLGDKLRFSVPIPKIWFALIPWGGMTVISLCMVASGEAPLPVGLMGVFGILLIIWNFLREEVLEASGRSITIWDDILGMKVRQKCYLAENIRELRVSADPSQGRIALDYGSATVTFGKSLDTFTANEILEMINRRFPYYRYEYGGTITRQASGFDRVLHPDDGYPKSVALPSPRHRSELIGTRLRITIPSLKKWPIIIFLIVWLAGWTFGCIELSKVVTRKSGDNFILLMFIFFLIAEIFGVYHLLWQLAGKERIEVSPDSIIIRQVIFGIGSPKVYTSEHISHMRTHVAGASKPYGLADEGISLSKGSGVITFNYKTEAITMGIGLDEAEAKQLVEEIQRQYPQYTRS